MPKPNILYIHSHDTGRYLQPYGHAIPDTELAAARRAGRAFPPRLLRRAHLLAQPRRLAHRAIAP